MGFLRKKFKQIKKGVKKIGKIFSSALDKLGISKILGKLGPLGSMALMFAMPYLGAWWTGLGAASPATTFIGQAAQTLHKVASSVGNVVLSPAKAIMNGLKAFGPTKDLITNATNLFKDAHNFVADKLGIERAFKPTIDPTKLQESFQIGDISPEDLPISQDTKALLADVKATDINLSNSPLLRQDISLDEIINPSFKGTPVDNFLINQRSAMGSASILEGTFYQDPVNLYGTNLEGSIPIKTDVKDLITQNLPEGAKDMAEGLLSKPGGVFEQKLGKLAGGDINWSNVTMDDFGNFVSGMPNLTPNDLASLVTDKSKPLGSFFGDTRTGTIWNTHNYISAAMREPDDIYNPGYNRFAGGLLQNEMSKIETKPVHSVSGNPGWAFDIESNKSLSSGNYGFHPNNIFTYDMFGDSFNVQNYLAGTLGPMVPQSTIADITKGL